MVLNLRIIGFTSDYFQLICDTRFRKRMGFWHLQTVMITHLMTHDLVHVICAKVPETSQRFWSVPKIGIYKSRA